MKTKSDRNITLLLIVILLWLSGLTYQLFHINQRFAKEDVKKEIQKGMEQLFEEKKEREKNKPIWVDIL